MPYGDISSNFHSQIEALSDAMATAGDATPEGLQTAWSLPEPNGWNGSPFSLTGAAGIGAAFDRDDLNAAYQSSVQTAATGEEDGGRVVDQMTTKLQLDYLAIAERAFRARHATIIRTAMHAAGRQQGQGGSNGIFRTVRDYLGSLLAQGYASDDSNEQ